MDRIVRLIERVSDSSGLLVAWLVFPLIIATCYEVFSRYVLNAPTIWAFELGYMAMGVHALMGSAYTLRHHAHIRIDVLYTHLPDKTKALIDTTGYVVLFLPVVSWLCLGLWDYWVEAYEGHELSGQSAWNPVIWPFRLAFFAGFALLWLQGLAELIKTFRFLTGLTDVWEGSAGSGSS
jgi:TRAP-type mannitol/chloroaromatic compound transport system permease small subunit